MEFKKTPGRLYPEHGGEPLPRPPVVAPSYMPHLYEAKRYVKVLQQELDAEIDNQPKWRGKHRAYLKRLFALWLMRADGKDGHYNKHGTFRRPFNADPPGVSDVVAEEWKRREEERGGKVSNRAHKKKFSTDYFKQASDRLVKREKGKLILPPDD